MGIRYGTSQYATGKTIAVIALIVVAGIFLYRHLRSGVPEPRPIGAAWFYDLNTGELFAARGDQRPPIAAPSGPLPDGSPAGVAARVFACEDCGNPLDAQIAWLEMFPPGDELYAMPLMADRDRREWVEVHSAEGMAIREAAMNRCGAAAEPVECVPTDGLPETP